MHPAFWIAKGHGGEGVAVVATMYGQQLAFIPGFFDLPVLELLPTLSLAEQSATQVPHKSLKATGVHTPNRVCEKRALSDRKKEFELDWTTKPRLTMEPPNGENAQQILASLLHTGQKWSGWRRALLRNTAVTYAPQKSTNAEKWRDYPALLIGENSCRQVVT